MKRFNKSEKKLIAGMSLLMGIRMLGISMIVPVLSHFAENLNGSSEQSVGLAIGIFGISQTLFQIPMGRLSDTWGRKEVSLLGFFIYLAGTIMCGFSKTIDFLTVSRFIAGAGAVSGVALTWITDGINVRYRNTAVSFLGMSIGTAVILGFPLSWFIASRLGANYVFFACASVTLIAIVYTALFLENNQITHKPDDQQQSANLQLTEILLNRDLVKLNIAGFIGSFCLTGIFNIMPRLLVVEIGENNMWLIFAPIAVIGTLLMFVLARKADKKGMVKIAQIGFAFELICLIMVIFFQNIQLLILSFILFYSGHCILSPILPVAVSRFPETGQKGTIMSLFTSSQFLGLGLGGIISGFILESYPPSILFAILAFMVLISMALILRFKDFQGEGGVNVGSPLDSID